MRNDGDIKKDVEDELRWTPGIDPTDIAVSVKNGVVTLTGFTRSYMDKYEAGARRNGVAGVLGWPTTSREEMTMTSQAPPPRRRPRCGTDRRSPATTSSRCGTRYSCCWTCREPRPTRLRDARQRRADGPGPGEIHRPGRLRAGPRRVPRRRLKRSFSLSSRWTRKTSAQCSSTGCCA